MTEVMTAGTLRNTANRFRLDDPSMSNAEVANHLNLTNGDKGFAGYPASCFFSDGLIAAIRLSDEEVAIFYTFQYAREKMKTIGTLITD